MLDFCPALNTAIYNKGIRIDMLVDLSDYKFWRFYFLNDLYKYEWVSTQFKGDIRIILHSLDQFEKLTGDYRYRNYLRHLGIIINA